MILKENVQQALTNCDVTYAELIEIANDICRENIGELNNLVETAYMNIENLSNDAIRDLMLRLSLKSYTFSEIKEKSAFKAALSETLRKEAYSKQFNSLEGSIAVRDNLANTNISAEIVVEEIYTLVASLLKTKLSEIHLVISTLQTVLTSRLTEAKLNLTGV